MAGGYLNMRTDWGRSVRKAENHCPRKIKHTRIAKLAGVTLPPTAESRKTGKKVDCGSNMMIQTCNLTSGEAEAGGSLQV